MSEPDREVSIVAGCDENYALGLAIALSSALRRLSQSYTAHVTVIDGGITPATRTRVERVVQKSRRNVQLQWHDGDVAQFEGLRTSNWGSHANYLRLLIPELVPEGTGLVLYLDSDILVTGDISELWEIGSGNRSGFHVAAVADYHHRNLSSVFGREGCEIIGVDPEAPYFNSGVLLIDVDRWREDHIPQQAIDFTRTHADLMRYSDQDALNIVLTSKWEPLDPTWNVMLPSAQRYLWNVAHDRSDLRQRYRGLLRQGKLFHFTGPKKPWTADYVGAKSLAYKRHLIASQWFATNREALQWSTRTVVGSVYPMLKRQTRRVLGVFDRTARAALARLRPT